MNGNNDRPGQEAVAVDSAFTNISSSPGLEAGDVLGVPRGMNRALRGPIIDLIRDGVPATELRRRGSGAVYSALCRTAASSAQRGWDCWEWEELILGPASKLGHQVRLRDAVRPRKAAAIQKMLDSAWDSATRWVSEQPPPFTVVEMAARAGCRADALLRLVEDPATDLLNADRRVLAYACEQARERGMDRVALPWRAVVETTGLGERSVKNSLKRLVAGSFLTLEDRGRPGTKKPRAALYRLAVEPLPVNGSVGPEALSCGTSTVSRLGTSSVPANPVGPLEVAVAVSPDLNTITLSFDSAHDMQRVREMLDEVTRSEATEPAPGESAQVLPLKRRTAS